MAMIEAAARRASHFAFTADEQNVFPQVLICALSGRVYEQSTLLAECHCRRSANANADRVLARDQVLLTVCETCEHLG